MDKAMPAIEDENWHRGSIVNHRVVFPVFLFAAHLRLAASDSFLRPAALSPPVLLRRAADRRLRLGPLVATPAGVLRSACVSFVGLI
jgi:hypothetical protein